METMSQMMAMIAGRESGVRSYCRTFPVVFARGKGAYLTDVDGKEYLDFFCGAGSLNYGHNPDRLKQALIDYLASDRIIQSLDMATEAKVGLLDTLEAVILRPRGMNYKIQFTGPTGANVIEAALKLARKATRRRGVVAFTNAYHGLSAGALSVTGNNFFRHPDFFQSGSVAFMPFDGYLGPDVDTLDLLERMLLDPGSGVDLPAAVILETVQAEGGVRIASDSWLRRLAALCQRFGILMIVDEIQVGNGRSGTFFSFESAGIMPDLIAMSKSLSGYGLPMSLLLIKPEWDLWLPGEHSGTFRGNNLAFVASREALEWWRDPEFGPSIRHNGERLRQALLGLWQRFPTEILDVRGKGLICGVELAKKEYSQAVQRTAFRMGLIVELCGIHDTIIKLLPPLIGEKEMFTKGVGILEQAFTECVREGVWRVA